MITHYAQVNTLKKLETPIYSGSYSTVQINSQRAYGNGITT